MTTNCAYPIRQVDSDEFADDIERLQIETELPCAKYDHIQWWFAFFNNYPIAYLGLMPSLVVDRAAYLVRVGVLHEHRGHSLQLRLMRVAERYARHHGYLQIVSDTTDNLASANNFIRAGYQLFAPNPPWAFSTSNYWRKTL